MQYERIVAGVIVWLTVCVSGASSQADDERPLREPTPFDDFEIREAMVPMRDGVKLYTLILSPVSADGYPIIMKRTPYDATGALSGHSSLRLDVTLSRQFLGDDYIYVFQDLRGRFKSEGDYAMYRVPPKQSL